MSNWDHSEKRYLTTSEAARRLRISNRTLEKHRYRGTGPIFMKIGGRVLYDDVNLDSWAAARARRCTRDHVGSGLPK